MDLTVIKISKEPFLQLYNSKFKALDFEHLPFNNFSILFPVGALLSPTQMLKDIEEKEGRKIDPIRETKVMQFIRKYTSEDAKLEVVVTNKSHMNVKVIDPRENTLFEFSVDTKLPVPLISHNEFTNAPMGVAISLQSLVYNLIDYINQPVRVIPKEVTELPQALTSRSHKNKNKNKTSQTHLRKVVYRINNLEPFEKPSRNYHYTCTSWNVRGFWRHYKSGKQVWIEPFKKGKEKDTTAKVKEYKITNLED